MIVLILLFALLAPLSPTESRLAHIIEGEALPGTCPLEASLAVAHVANNAPGATWYGWKTPGPQARAVARYWHLYPDPTNGANHLFSKSDVAKANVSRIIGERAPTWSVECRGGLGLRSFFVP
jgi:hypothetical protein